MADSQDSAESVLHYFVDEAGDGTLFSGSGKVLIGSVGCSKYFILGKLEVGDPVSLAQELERLRSNLLADPYFRGVPSMQPQQRKTALAFHAKDDLPEVRREVFQLLARQDVRFYAVVRDKKELLAFVAQQNQRDSAYRYRPDELYDTLVSELFSKLHHWASRTTICFAKRGSRNRTQALRTALDLAQERFLRDFGFANATETTIRSSTPHRDGALQAVDYFLWALQRFYELGEERYVQLIWPLVGEVYDLDFLEQGRRGVYYRKDKPLWLGGRGAQKKKPEDIGPTGRNP